ncbi:NPP1 family protein [Streptomyces sp. NPDC127072]|uniref:NPP1 family protein n=1 Tax=Streptomyces sp. NPDC127072 TaxID=3347129 RepID=UPI0036520934
MKRNSRIGKVSLIFGSAVALVVAFPGIALAAPPTALPANANGLEQTFQPAFDYDTDGCYPTPAIGSDGTLNAGLNPSGALNGSCRDASDLTNTNGYSREKCNNGWCAIMYALYFEKDQAVAGSGLGGHRHDWEHVVVWVQDNTAKYVSTSAHGDFNTYSSSQIRWDGTHPKVVYHKDGISTHCFRPANSNDEPPENHQHVWQFPRLVGWGGYPAGVRDKLTAANFGSATLGIKDGNFNHHLEQAEPAGIPFDSNA